MAGQDCDTFQKRLPLQSSSSALASGPEPHENSAGRSGGDCSEQRALGGNCALRALPAPSEPCLPLDDLGRVSQELNLEEL